MDIEFNPRGNPGDFVGGLYGFLQVQRIIRMLSEHNVEVRHQYRGGETYDFYPTDERLIFRGHFAFLHGRVIVINDRDHSRVEYGKFNVRRERPFADFSISVNDTVTEVGRDLDNLQDTHGSLTSKELELLLGFIHEQTKPALEMEQQKRQEPRKPRTVRREP